MKNFFFDIFAIHSSSRHEKRCQMSLRFFSLFRGSIYQQCVLIQMCANSNVHQFESNHATIKCVPDIWKKSAFSSTARVYGKPLTLNSKEAPGHADHEMEVPRYKGSYIHFYDCLCPYGDFTNFITLLHRSECSSSGKSFVIYAQALRHSGW